MEQINALDQRARRGFENTKQQLVLDWLKDHYVTSQWSFPFYVVKYATGAMPEEIFDLYDELTKKEQFEVLAAFAQWGLESR